MLEPSNNSLSSQDISGWTDTHFGIEKHNSKTPWTAFQPEGDNRREVLFLTSYPPRVCGIATYCQDLIKALANKFNESFSLRVCALETGDTTYQYPEEVRYRLNSSSAAEYKKMTAIINRDEQINIVLIQHEFGLFNKQEQAFLQFLQEIKKPVILAFHTVLPQPDKQLKAKVQHMVEHCTAVVVMTHNSEQVLIEEYDVPEQKITVIAHGTHLVPHVSKDILKEKYGLKGRKVLTTFGLLSSGKSIETTLEALPAIIEECPEVIFLVIGKTHPEVVKAEGETYRERLKALVMERELGRHVQFINSFLALPELLEYLQLTDIYLFTSSDPNQAVSGTFAYAMSCACPIISTPIPHAKEALSEDTGIIIDFDNPRQLAAGAVRLLNDDSLRHTLSFQTLQQTVSTAWENSAVAHAMLLDDLTAGDVPLQYTLPPVSLDHLQRMTTPTGIIQFSKVNQPDIESGYTLDDNARALVATAMYVKLTGDRERIDEIHRYLRFITHCQQSGGRFQNYVDKNNRFTGQNEETNLDDSNGRAIWALGYIQFLKEYLPEEITSEARRTFEKALQAMATVHSPRAMAFTIKGLYFFQSATPFKNPKLLNTLAHRLAQMYNHESNGPWKWFEGYLTYANSILPEAMLYAWQVTGDNRYREIALSSFDFLLSKIFTDEGIEVISNKNWLNRGQTAGKFGEQPIDVAYTILTLDQFYHAFGDEEYYNKMVTAFNWFLGQNRLHQIIYNPCTGGCYDGLEEKYVNLNQGAESTVSYLLARLTMGKYHHSEDSIGAQKHNQEVS